MHHFSYRGGVLHAEDVSLISLADRVGTPLYCYSTATLERHYSVFSDAFAGLDTLVCYAVKANSNISVIRTLGRLGSGADVVSEGELRRALAAGIPPERIVFSGIGKMRSEMAFALKSGIYAFNVESEPELHALNEVAISLGSRARIAFRVNPDVDAKTHHKISTGKSEHKFGVPLHTARALYAAARALPGIAVAGVHMHIGSQITDLEPFRNAFDLLSGLVETLEADGHHIAFVNLGGGLGIPYRSDVAAPPEPRDYAAIIAPFAGKLRRRLLFEPGRMIAGNAGILLTRVIYVKEGEGKRFVIVDAGMNDLIRPTLYDAHHEIWPVREELAARTSFEADVVGPVCETGDFFAKSRKLAPVEAGDLVAIMTAGAYGAVQASQYNSRALIPEVLVSAGDFAVVRARPSHDDILRSESIAPWLNQPVLAPA